MGRSLALFMRPAPGDSPRTVAGKCGECTGGDGLVAEGIPVYQARGQALLCRGLCFAGVAGAGAMAPMHHGGPEGSGKRGPDGVGAA